MNLVDLRFWLIFLALTLFVLGCRESPLKYSIRYHSLGDLKANVPVYFDITQVGHVDKVVSADHGDYAVEVLIDPAYKGRVTENSKFFISADPYFSDRKAIIIEQEPPGGAILPDGSVVQGEESRGLWGELVKSLKNTTRNASDKVKKSMHRMQESVAMDGRHLSGQLEQSRDQVDDYFQGFDPSLQATPNDVDLERLQQSLDEFLVEFKSSSDELQQMMRTQILPNLRRNLEGLRDWLKDQGRDSDADKIDREIEEIVRV